MRLVAGEGEREAVGDRLDDVADQRALARLAVHRHHQRSKHRLNALVQRRPVKTCPVHRHIADAEVAGPPWLKNQIAAAEAGKADSKEALTPYQHVTGYNNFYEFGYDKTDPAAHADSLTTDPWKVEIAGEVNKPGSYNLDDLLKGLTLEERIYRLRCVEAWSMVIPWIGFSLADLLKRFEPTSKAKYVAFTTLMRPEEMPAQKSRLSTIKWPYREGLRMDEAMHPLTSKISNLRRRMIVWQRTAAACWTLATVLAAVRVLGAIDYIVRYSDPGLRILASAAFAAVVVWALLAVARLVVAGVRAEEAVV